MGELKRERARRRANFGLWDVIFDAGRWGTGVWRNGVEEDKEIRILGVIFEAGEWRDS